MTEPVISDCVGLRHKENLQDVYIQNWQALSLSASGGCISLLGIFSKK